MSLRRMKPVLLILGLALFMFLIGWTWSELPRPTAPFAPEWTRSYQLYRQPHAIWLDCYERPGANLTLLTRALKAAARQRQVPEFVVYAIPLRDLGQSSEGGFASYEDYLADNRLNAELIGRFVRETAISPVVYLEPDSIPLAVQYRRDHNDNAESWQIYRDRIRVMKTLIALYRGAGAQVYLEGGHSGWFDYGEPDVQRIAAALNEAGIGSADGLATNVSNRQPVSVGEHNEFHYLSRLLPLLDKPSLDVRVDTSRNGGVTRARQYYLSPDGRLIDNEVPTGRLVGKWHQDARGTVWLEPFFGTPKSLTRLLAKEKYTLHPLAKTNEGLNRMMDPWADQRDHGGPDNKALTYIYEPVTHRQVEVGSFILLAPAWLDAVGDVQPGPAPTDAPEGVADVIHHFRYIKPPDDCDGALNCPPGMSKSEINLDTAKRQPEIPLVPPGFWRKN